MSSMLTQTHSSGEDKWIINCAHRWLKPVSVSWTLSAVFRDVFIQNYLMTLLIGDIDIYKYSLVRNTNGCVFNKSQSNKHFLNVFLLWWWRRIIYLNFEAVQTVKNTQYGEKSKPISSKVDTKPPWSQGSTGLGWWKVVSLFSETDVRNKRTSLQVHPSAKQNKWTKQKETHRHREETGNYHGRAVAVSGWNRWMG